MSQVLPQAVALENSALCRCVNSSPPGQNCCLFVDGIFICLFKN